MKCFCCRDIVQEIQLVFFKDFYGKWVQFVILGLGFKFYMFVNLMFSILEVLEFQGFGQ